MLFANRVIGEGSREEVNNQPSPDLIKITEIFLIPSSFLVAALGAADTNPHRAAVSVLGVIVSGLWWICSHEAISEMASATTRPLELRQFPRRVRILSWLPIIFTLGWLASIVAHVLLWKRPLGQ